MKGTVNGKSLDQVLSELKAPFPEEELKKNEKNETYIPVESLESRLNSVIGVLNYDTLVTYEGIQEVLGRFVVVAKTILIIYDDERNALIRKSALGGVIHCCQRYWKAVQFKNGYRSCTIGKFQKCM